MNVAIPAIQWTVIGPELVLIGTAIGLMLLVVLVKKAASRLTPTLTLAGATGAMALCFSLWGKSATSFHDMVVLDHYALFFKILFLMTTVLTALMSIRYLKREEFEQGEYYILLLFATVGMMLMASAADLIIIFLGLETFSLSVYVLVGFSAARPSPTSPP